MTVKELIEKLSKMDQEKDVLIVYSNRFQASTIETVEESESVYIVESK